MIVTIEVNTILKRRILSSADLADSEKINLLKGAQLEIDDWAPDCNQHISLELAKPAIAQDGKTQLKQVYAYDPHVRIEGDQSNQLIKLPVRYQSQLNNDPSIFGPGWRQCNTSSNAMLADYLLKGDLSKQSKARGFSEPESLYMRIVSKYGDTTDHGAHTKALEELGIESYFSYTLSATDLLASLRSNIPVVAGFAYKGSGHICLIVGYNPANQSWLVHDPYGTRHGASDSYDVGIGGAYDIYTNQTMQQIFWDQGREAGWGRVVTSVNGKAGMPKGF
jgi:hypothetical protein